MFLVSRVKMRNYFLENADYEYGRTVFFSLNMQTVLVSGAWISGKRKNTEKYRGLIL